MQFHGEVSIVIYNKVKSCFRNTQISSRESLLKPAHGFAVTMITILLVVCAAYEKTAEAARSEFYRERSQLRLVSPSTAQSFTALLSLLSGNFWEGAPACTARLHVIAEVYE